MSPDLLLFAVGGLLLVTGLLGGGFELRELKIPKVGKIARVCATGAGGACIILGLGLSTALTPAAGDTGEQGSGPIANPSPAPSASPDSGSVHFVIRDELGENQISEQVTVILDGRRVGSLTVNTDYPTSDLEVSVDDAGRHDYTLSVSSLEIADDGSYVEREASGQGTITAEPGASYQVAYAGGGEDRDVTLMAD